MVHIPVARKAAFHADLSNQENSLQIPTVAEVPGDGDPVAVRPAAHDAYKVCQRYLLRMDYSDLKP